MTPPRVRRRSMPAADWPSASVHGRSGLQRPALAIDRIDESALRCGDRVVTRRQPGDAVAPLLVRGGSRATAAATDAAAADQHPRALHRPPRIRGDHAAGDSRLCLSASAGDRAAAPAVGRRVPPRHPGPCAWPPLRGRLLRHRRRHGEHDDGKRERSGGCGMIWLYDCSNAIVTIPAPISRNCRAPPDVATVQVRDQVRHRDVEKVARGERQHIGQGLRQHLRRQHHRAGAERCRRCPRAG